MYCILFGSKRFILLEKETKLNLSSDTLLIETLIFKIILSTDICLSIV